jgi:hypothetical protein
MEEDDDFFVRDILMETPSTRGLFDGDTHSVDEDSLATTERYDWEKEKQKKLQFYDDGTMSYFW